MVQIDASLRKIDSIELGYCVGLFEGEGHVSHQHGWSIGIAMTDKEPLERIHRLFGGRLTGPYNRNKKIKESYKDFYAWTLNGYNAVLNFFEVSNPYLSPRRIEQFIPILEKKPLPKLLSPFCGLGTHAGFQRHRNHNEPPCLECRISSRQYEWEYNHKGDIWPGLTQKFMDRYGITVPRG